MGNNIKPVTNPEEAAAQFAGEQYMDWVMGYIDQQARSWPSLQAIAHSAARPEKVRKFMVQRYLAVEALAGGKDGDPGFLGFAVANLSEASDPGAESALEIMEAKRMEISGPEGQASGPLKTQWSKLLHGLGASVEELARAEAKEPTRNYVSELSDAYSNGEWQSAMAAFVAQERLVPEECAAMSSLLKSNTELSAADMEVMSWHPKQAAHRAMDASRVLEQVAVDQEGKDLVFQGIRRQLDATHDFYDGLVKYLQDS